MTTLPQFKITRLCQGCDKVVKKHCATCASIFYPRFCACLFRSKLTSRCLVNYTWTTGPKFLGGRNRGRRTRLGRRCGRGVFSVPPKGHHLSNTYWNVEMWSTTKTSVVCVQSEFHELSVIFFFFWWGGCTESFLR